MMRDRQRKCGRGMTWNVEDCDGNLRSEEECRGLQSV